MVQAEAMCSGDSVGGYESARMEHDEQGEASGGGGSSWREASGTHEVVFVRDRSSDRIRTQ